MKKLFLVAVGIALAGCSQTSSPPTSHPPVAMRELTPAQAQQKRQQENARLAGQAKSDAARMKQIKLTQLAEQKRLAKEKRDAKRAERRTARVVRRELPTYEKAGMKWRNILIRSGTSQSDMTKLAQKLHSEDPTSNFHFFDDDAQFQQHMDWDINYPDSNYPYPEAWSDKHIVGMVNKMAGDNGIQWQLGDGMGQRIAPLTD